MFVFLSHLKQSSAIPNVLTHFISFENKDDADKN